MNMQDWITELNERLSVITTGYARIQGDGKTTQVFINYINLPPGMGNAGGGAEAENNRIMLTVLFPGPATWYDKAVAEGTLRVKHSVMAVKGPTLRGKTCSPEKMIDYITNYLVNISQTVPANYTHTKAAAPEWVFDTDPISDDNQYE